MKEIKTIFFDIDGTLIPFKETKVPKEVLEAIQMAKKKGYKVGLATSRPMTLIQRAENIFEIEWDGIVASSGTKLYDGQCHLLKEHSLPLSVQESIFHIADQNQIAIYTCGNESYFTKESDIISWFKDTYQLECDSFHPYNHKETELITLLGDNQDWIRKLYSKIEGIRFVKGGTYNLDIFPAQINKMTGIHEFMKSWGFHSQDYLCFGDTQGDHEMILDAQIGIAMPKSSQDTKEIADFVCQDIPSALRHFHII